MRNNGPNQSWLSKYTAGPPFTQGNPFKRSQIQRNYAPPKGSPGVKCTPRSLSYTQKHALSKVLVRYVLPAESSRTGTQNIVAYVYSPSSRMRCRITVAIEPDNQGQQGDPAFNVTPQWSITNINRNPETGRETPLQLAYPDTGLADLPDSAEFDTASELFRVNVTLADNAFSSSYIPNTQRANVVLFAHWEPNLEMTKEEYADLTALCSITYGTALEIQNNAV